MPLFRQSFTFGLIAVTAIGLVRLPGLPAAESATSTPMTAFDATTSSPSRPALTSPLPQTAWLLSSGPDTPAVSPVAVRADHPQSIFRASHQ